jgi:hypothetical protein
MPKEPFVPPADPLTLIALLNACAMKSPAEVAVGLRGCFLCGRNPIVLTGMVLPVDDASYAMILTLRTTPVPEDESPALGYGLCQEHARDTQRSTALVHAKLLDAAASVVAQ